MIGLGSHQDVQVCDICGRDYLHSRKWGRCPLHENVDEVADECEAALKARDGQGGGDD